LKQKINYREAYNKMDTRQFHSVAILMGAVAAAFYQAAGSTLISDRV
jgi:hypothetical protein